MQRKTDCGLGKRTHENTADVLEHTEQTVCKWTTNCEPDWPRSVNSTQTHTQSGNSIHFAVALLGAHINAQRVWMCVCV